jgi:hypothetical protein
MCTRVLQFLVACTSTLALFAAGAWLGGKSASAAATSGAAGRRNGLAAGAGAAFAARGAERELALGDALSVNGQPMQLSIFFTGDPPEKVIAWYSDALAKKGLVPFAHVEAQVGHVSVFDPEEGVQRFATALPQGDGETLVMVGTADPRKPPRLLGGARSAPFPVPSEQRGFFAYASDDAGIRSHNAHFVAALDPASVLAFYRKALASDGFAEAPGESGEAMALFRKRSISVSVAAQSLGEKGGAAVFVSRLEGGPR